MTELKNFQVAELREHLSKHRYYLGEQGIHVDDHTLENDFVRKYFKTVCHDMRLDFCNNICHVADCELRIKFNQKG